MLKINKGGGGGEEEKEEEEEVTSYVIRYPRNKHNINIEDNKASVPIIYLLIELL